MWRNPLMACQNELRLQCALTTGWYQPTSSWMLLCMTFSFRPSGSGCWKASHWCETKMASPLSRVYSTSKPCSNDTSWLLTSWMARKLSSGIVNMGKSSFSVAHSCCFSGARTASAKRSKAVARPLLLQLDPHRIMATRRLGDGKSQELAICPKRQTQIFVSLHVTCVPGCDVPHVCHRCYA